MARGTAVPAMLLAAASATASPESTRLVSEGVGELKRGAFAAALEKFQAATHADPRDAEALFYRGVAANRLGDFPAARAALLDAEARGLSRPEMDFELGWNALGTGRFRECIERLERFDRAQPGRGQAAEFLGRCHLALGQHVQAEARFRQAVERDPRLAPTVDLSMASLEQARGRPQEARERIEAASASDAPSGRALRELAGPPAPVAQPERPLRLSASFTLGHNDNVIGLGNTVPLPTDITDEGAWFYRIGLGGGYTRQLTERTAASVGYALLLDRYDGLGASNLNDHFLYGDLYHELSPRSGASLRVHREYTDLGGAKFRQSWGARPAYSRRFLRNSVTEISYGYTDSHYHVAVPRQFDRSGHTHVLGALHSFRVGGTPWSGAASLTRTRNDTEGADFASEGAAIAGTIRYAFRNRVSASAGLSWSRDDFRNANSLVGFAFPRRDKQSVFSAQITGPLTTQVRWFMHAQMLRNDSNIAFFDYKQNVVSGGVTADF